MALPVCHFVAHVANVAGKEHHACVLVVCIVAPLVFVGDVGMDFGLVVGMLEGVFVVLACNTVSAGVMECLGNTGFG